MLATELFIIKILFIPITVFYRRWSYMLRADGASPRRPPVYVSYTCTGRAGVSVGGAFLPEWVVGRSCPHARTNQRLLDLNVPLARHQGYAKTGNLEPLPQVSSLIPGVGQATMMLGGLTASGEQRVISQAKRTAKPVATRSSAIVPGDKSVEYRND